MFHVQNEPENSHQVCEFMWAGNFWILSQKKENAEQMMEEVVDNTYAMEERLDMEIETAGLKTHLTVCRRVQDPGALVQS